MFYSQFILAKKGPLGTIWIAAHLERKLRKNQVSDTDIGVSVDSILFPDVPIALRLSSHLLLGVVRIYSRKVNYLFDDCSEALLKIKQAFRSTAVDLPPEESTAPYHSITLPETFDLDDFELPDHDIFQGNYVDHHVSTREQITLQDSFEGVVYSTSQFGLDERFGDGDASQIGLDLDEVLLTDKAASLEHDDCGSIRQVSHQKDENIEEIDDLPTAVEVTDFAEGPSTPGLEEPNLFGTQMDQVNNGADYHNSEDFTSVKRTENVSSVHQKEINLIDCTLPNNVKQLGADSHPENSDSLMNDMDGKREEQEYLACRMMNQEYLLHNDHCSASLPLMVSPTKDYSTACASGMINASDIPEKMEDLYDEVLMDKEPATSPLVQTVIDDVSAEVCINEVATPSFSHVPSDQEYLSCKLLSNMDGFRGPESDGHLEECHTLSKNEDLNDHEVSRKEGESCRFDEAQKSFVISPERSPRIPQAVDVEVEDVQPTESILRPCTYHLNQPSLPSVEGEKYHETGRSEPALGYQKAIEPSNCKENLDLGMSDVRGGSQIFSDKPESISKSAASEMPEPEKLLSRVYQHDGEANDLLMESTPDNQGISDGLTVAVRVKGISGRKRSFTESTLTVQSVDLVESYGGAQSKRTASSIPDDDDLLSSILVGRGSSVLKVKPSPAAPEIASTKHFRSGPHTSAVKRKVLMDDMMVLHGDTIRQQLRNTEDIRRIRKKAPCTQQEIVKIQRQFLEDRIFHESIFTGLSSDLIVLRNETFDLTRIKVFCDGLDSFFIEKTNTEVHEVERNVESISVQLQGVAYVQPTEISVLSESHLPEVNLVSNDTDTYGHPNIVSHVKEFDSSQNAEMNNAGVEIYSAGPGHESSSLAEVGNNLCIPNDFVAPMPLVDKANDPVGSVHTDISCIPSDQNLNTSLILKENFVEDKDDRSETAALENQELSLEIRTQTDDLEASDLYASMATGSKGIDEYTGNQISFNEDLAMQENGNNMVVVLNEDSGLGCDDKRFDCMFGESTKVDCSESVPLAMYEKESYLKDEECSFFQEAGLQSAVCLEFSAPRSPFVGHNDENDLTAGDTGFLNVGDDEIIDDDDDFTPCAEGTHLENSGWSSRTRAVAKYLQTLFEKDDLNGRQNLHLDNILAGKTRKEASRMFFETLVLKTRDYVHVEQPKPFSCIYLKPRMKLMKSDF